MCKHSHRQYRLEVVCRLLLIPGGQKCFANNMPIVSIVSVCVFGLVKDFIAATLSCSIPLRE